MLVKIAAIEDDEEESPAGVVVVREYEEERDKVVVEEMERQCEFGQADNSNYTLLTDLLGDPLARIRNFLSHVMLVADYGEETSQIVGVIRGCIKTVTIGKTFPNGFPVYLKLGYILGLRVSPTHRRLGIGAKLVKHLEEWCKQNGADYTYMATDCSNQPSINLFTRKLDYVIFRNPTMLVHPVHAHYKPLSSGNISIVRVQPQLAELIYARVFGNSEFFPKDMNNILTNKLSLGTFMALPKKCLANWDSKIESLPHKFAILSIWNTKEVFKLQVKGASRLTYAWCAGSRVLDKLMPWLRLPSIPNVFEDFGVYFLYGLHMKGKGASRLMKSLCSLAHNMARDDVGCGAVVAEVGQWDPVREAIPHWSKFSLDEDMWCIKKLTDAKHEMPEMENVQPYDWVQSPSSASVIFVDPRDF